MKRITKTGYSIGSKVFMITASILGIALCFWAAIEYIKEDKLYHIFAVVIPFFSLCTIGIWHTFKLKLIITEEYIEYLEFFKPKRLYFDKVDHIYLFEKEMRLKGGRIKIRITSDLQNQKEIISYLVDKFKNYQNIEVSGEQKVIDSVFGATSGNQVL